MILKARITAYVEYFVTLKCNKYIMHRDHSFPRQIFPNYAVQSVKFCGSLWQIYHI